VFEHTVLSVSSLLNFIHDHLPNRSVKVIQHEVELNDLLNQQDGVKVILFSNKKEPTTLEMELNHVFGDYLTMCHFYVSTENSDWLNKKYPGKISSLPSILLKNEKNEIHWNLQLNKMKLIDFLTQHGMEDRIPTLKSNSMINEYCFEMNCFLFSSNRKQEEKLKIIKKFTEKLGFVNDFEKMKIHTQTVGEDFLLIFLNVKQKKYTIFNSKFNENNLRMWIRSIEANSVRYSKLKPFLNEEPMRLRNYFNYIIILVSLLIILISLKFI
jgi:hypothetical protein